MSRTSSPALNTLRTERRATITALPASPLIFPKLRSFVRVRPFTDAEAKFVPEGQVVARPIVDRQLADQTGSLVILDPANKFRPKKGGSFPIDNVLWSFYDEGDPGALRHLQPEVYDMVVSPVIPSICEGYSSLFMIYGGPESGKWTTMYGDDAPGSATSLPPGDGAPSSQLDKNKGLLYRFTAEIFDSLKRTAPNATLTLEYECVEIAGEQYIDLLAPPAKKGKESELRVVTDADGSLRLNGITRNAVANSAALEHGIRQALRPMKKRKSTHCVILRFTETHEFQDPEKPTAMAKVSKSRRINVAFAFLRNVPHSFHRCFDVAIERDSGDNAQSIVPTRECAFTRLFADMFAQQYLVTCISCVSPFCEHTKDAMSTLPFANRIKKIKTGAKLLQDEKMAEMRTLAEEVRGLHCEVAKINESMVVVQQELDRRQNEIQRQEDIHAEQSMALDDGLSVAEKEKLVRVVKSLRLVSRKRQTEAAIKQLQTRLTATTADVQAVVSSSEALRQQCHKEAAQQQLVEVQISEVGERMAPLQAIAEERREAEAAVDEMEKYNNAAPEERQAQVKELFATRENLQRLIPQLEVEKKAARGELGEAKIKHDEVKPSYDQVLAQEAEIKKRQDLSEQLAKVEQEIASLQGESKRLQDEIEKAPSAACCSIM